MTFRPQKSIQPYYVTVATVVREQCAPLQATSKACTSTIRVNPLSGGVQNFKKKFKHRKSLERGDLSL